MPELPDITVYIEALSSRLISHRLRAVRLSSPFLLRTADPPLTRIEGRTLRELRRIGKRIAFGFDDDYWAVLHLMVAGRLHWKAPGASAGGRNGLAAFDFDSGTLTLTEAGSKKRASLHVLRGEQALAEHDPGGVEPLTASLDRFATALRRENHTLKRALTDPSLFSGIGNAYSGEILHAARLSPVTWTSRLSDEQVQQLHRATVQTLQEGIAALRRETGEEFPEKVTAFRDGMAVHGRYRKPCPRCGAEIQRIRYASRETNYCAPCQTGGRLLADRSLSRLLKSDWPRSIEQLEARRGPKSGPPRTES